MYATATPADTTYGANATWGRHGIDIDTWWAYCPDNNLVVAIFQIEGWSHGANSDGSFDCVTYLQSFDHEVNGKVEQMEQAAREIRQMTIKQFWGNVDNGKVRPLSTVHT